MLVTYQRGEQLREYFASLARQTRPLDRLLVVDNDPDGSAHWILDEHGLPSTSVEYESTGENIGPAGGIAFGMKRLLEGANDNDWILTLDDDDPPQSPEMIEVLHDFGEALVRAGKPVGGVGLCGGRFDIDQGRFLTVPEDELTGAVNSSWIGGNQLPCYRVSAVREVGVFDPRWFINFEELDYGMRMNDHGYQLFAHGELWRHERDRLGRTNVELAPERRLTSPSWRRYYSLRNLIVLLNERGHRRVGAKVALAALAKPTVNLARSPALAVQHLRLNTRAVLDAYRLRMGRTMTPAPKPYVRRT